MVFVRCDLVVLQQDEAEVELAEGQFQVFDVAVFVPLLVAQSQTHLPALSYDAVPLSVQRGLQLVLERGETPLSLR